MKVVNLNKVKREKKGAPLFTEEVEIQTPISEADGSELNVGYVHFPKGVRNKFHTHTHDQVLIAVEGEGFYKTRKKRFKMRKGDVAWSKAGEEHSHGATK